VADALDHSRLRKLHERATRSGSEYDRDTFARAAFVVVPEMLAERDRLRAALRRIRDNDLVTQEGLDGVDQDLLEQVTGDCRGPQIIAAFALPDESPRLAPWRGGA
jgi:hypothetical protein